MEQLVEVVIASMLQDVLGTMEKQEPLSMNDVMAMITGQIGQIVLMYEENIDQFEQLMKKLMGQTDKEIEVK